jgi:DNA-directed RNA polymerase specialized sigma24 family protein
VPDETAKEPSNLLTPELHPLLYSGEKGALAEWLFPYVHTAARQFSSLHGLSPDDTDDLVGDALLHAINRLVAKNQKKKLHKLTAGFIYTLVRDCYVQQRRNDRFHPDHLDHYDSSAAYDYDDGYADVREEQKLDTLLNREALIEVIQHLDAMDRQTLDRFLHHYDIHQDSTEPGTDMSDPGVFRAAIAAVTRHTTLSLGLKPGTMYKRLTRMNTHLSELMTSERNREIRN